MFTCTDCGIDTSKANEYYMVNDLVWVMAGMPFHGGGKLCISCLENRLGRELTPKDFIDAPVNWDQPEDQSPRLRNRLGYEVL